MNEQESICCKVEKLGLEAEMETVLNVLAVEDPAVMGYVDKSTGIIENYGKKVVMDVVPWAEYYPTMLDVFAGKANYDIIMVAGHLWKKDFQEKGYLQALELDQEDILPVIYKEMHCGEAAYLSPSFCDGHMIVYDKKIIKEVFGTELKKVIEPQEYIEISRKLYENGHNIVMKADISEILTDALPFLRMNGIDVYDVKTKGVQCDDERVMEGLKQYCGLKEYAVENTEKFGNVEVAEHLKNKKAAMGVTWSGQLGVVCGKEDQSEVEFGFSTFSTAWNVTWSFAVTATSNHKEEAELFLAYLRSEKVDQLAGEFSGAPVRKSSYDIGASRYPWYSCQLEMFEKAKPLPDLDKAGDKNGVLYAEIHRAFNGEKDVEVAMKDAKEAILNV